MSLIDIVLNFTVSFDVYEDIKFEIKRETLLLLLIKDILIWEISNEDSFIEDIKERALSFIGFFVLISIFHMYPASEPENFT